MIAIDISIKDQRSIPSCFHIADLDRECIRFGQVKDACIGKGNLYLFCTLGQFYCYTVDLQRCNCSSCSYIQIALIPSNTELAAGQEGRPLVSSLCHVAIHRDGSSGIRCMDVVRIHYLLRAFGI